LNIHFQLAIQKQLAKKSFTIYLPEELLTELKRESQEDSVSLNQRVLTLLLVGRRAESSTERDNERTIREIQRLVAEEVKRQNQQEFIQSDRVRPLNRYEFEKQRERERAEPEPTPEPYQDDFTRIYGGVKNPRQPESQSDRPDPYNTIYDGMEKQEELEERAERYLQSNWHPDFHD